MNSTRALRAEMRARRRAVSEPERALMAESLARNLGRSPRVRRARRVAGYLCNDAEMDPAPILDLLRANGATVLLPALHRRALWFLPYDRDTPLVANRFGIAEPDAGGRGRCRARDLDLVLVPLVAFDCAGNRIGMGGGFYDRTFAFLRNRAYWQKPRLIGIAYEFQRLETLPSQPWDVPLHGVATEKRLCFFDGRGR